VWTSLWTAGAVFVRIRENFAQEIPGCARRLLARPNKARDTIHSTRAVDGFGTSVSLRCPPCPRAVAAGSRGRPGRRPRQEPHPRPSVPAGDDAARGRGLGPEASGLPPGDLAPDRPRPGFASRPSRAPPARRRARSAMRAPKAGRAGPRPPPARAPGSSAAGAGPAGPAGPLRRPRRTRGPGRAARRAAQGRRDGSHPPRPGTRAPRSFRGDWGRPLRGKAGGVRRTHRGRRGLQGPRRPLAFRTRTRKRPPGRGAAASMRDVEPFGHGRAQAACCAAYCAASNSTCSSGFSCWPMPSS
jgi:hypothetical protein